MLEENIPLAPLTTLGVGGPARYLCRARDEAEACAALAWAQARRLPIWLLGGGSNVIIADAGLPGLVLMPAIGGRRILADDDLGSATPAVELETGAGENWDAFVAWTVAQELAGLECLSGIPGSVGATPVQNVGAYGQEIAACFLGLRAVEIATGNRVEFSRDQCDFGYRRSRFNRADAGRYLITRVRWQLCRHGPPALRYAELRARLGEQALPATLAQTRAAVLEIRRRKGMVLEAGDPERCSAGSFFKNPVLTPVEFDALARRTGEPPPRFEMPADAGAGVKLPAAWLIERAGFHKGYRAGRVGISSRHALALINHGGASAAELLALAAEIVAGVRARFGVELALEPVGMGFAGAILPASLPAAP